MADEVYSQSGLTRPTAFLFRRVSWGAIFAGIFVTMILQLLFMMLGLALGTTMETPWTRTALNGGLTLGSEIWLLVTGLISLFFGAATAGRLSGGPRIGEGMLHGIVTWSVSTFATIFLLTSLSASGIGGLGSLVGFGLVNPGPSQVSLGDNTQSESGSKRLSPTGREAPNDENAPGANENQNLAVAGGSNGLSNAWWGFIALISGLVVATLAGWMGTASLPEPANVVVQDGTAI